MQHMTFNFYIPPCGNLHFSILHGSMPSSSQTYINKTFEKNEGKSLYLLVVHYNIEANLLKLFVCTLLLFNLCFLLMTKPSYSDFFQIGLIMAILIISHILYPFYILWSWVLGLKKGSFGSLCKQKSMLSLIL